MHSEFHYVLFLQGLQVCSLEIIFIAVVAHKGAFTLGHWENK